MVEHGDRDSVSRLARCDLAAAPFGDNMAINYAEMIWIYNSLTETSFCADNRSKKAHFTKL